MELPDGPNTLSAGGIIVGLISGGIVNTSVLVWLAMQYMKISTKLAVMETHINYLRREIAYVNGRAEPDDDEDRRK